MPKDSYTTSLFESGVNRMAQKVGEEAVETVIEATNGTPQRMVYEGADLLYHLIVLLTSKGYRIEDLAHVLVWRLRHLPVVPRAVRSLYLSPYTLWSPAPVSASRAIRRLS